MRRRYAFIDETGNHDLDTGKPGSSNYFLILAVLVDDERRESLEFECEVIRKKYFGSGEIKSSGIRDRRNKKRRVDILTELKSLDFKFYLFAVNKKELTNISPGLRHKKSFIKFCNGITYKNLLSTADEVNIFADAHGDPEFQDSFKSYIMENTTGDLFKDAELEVVDSKNNILVQLADLLVGSLAKYYEGKEVSKELSFVVRQLIRDKCLKIDEWPRKLEPLVENKYSSEFDNAIYKFSLAKAVEFLDKNEGADDYDRSIQSKSLEYLLFRDKFDENPGYVHTYEIINYLREFGFGTIKDQALRSSVIAKLRDSGVIIASSSHGYRIPRTSADLQDYANRVNGLVIPLLTRVKKAREGLRLATNGEYDLLSGDSYKNLRSFIDFLAEGIIEE
jgi:hypothetical protein